MALKVYYDGSSDEQRREAVTLSGVAATESVWAEFEPLWDKVLEKYLVQDRILHMTDLMSFRGNFSPDKGWDEKQRHALLADLFNVYGHFDRQRDLEARSCTVILRDWARAKREMPKLVEPEAICVNFCVGGLRLPLECANEAKPILLYFDKNEPFMHKINRVWQRRRKIRNTFFRQIRTIKNVDSEYYPIQAADILAWIMNHSHRGIHDEFFELASVLAIRHFSECYDYDQIIADYPMGWLRPRTLNGSSA
jgi:hypothetical protein